MLSFTRTAILLLSVFAVLPAAAQTTFASITGTVTDAQGSVVSNAKKEATHVASNYTYSVVSNESGNYTLAQLREGDYVLKAAARL